jgi:PIN domain nuclease of toxin-antitoxin system
LSPKASDFSADLGPERFASVVTIWEVAIKSGLGRSDMNMDAKVLRANVLRAGFQEISVTADHVLAVRDLPPIRRDPFDRLLLAQAIVEGLTLVTADAVLSLSR